MGNIQAGKGEIFSAMARAQKSMSESSSRMGAGQSDDEQHVSPETPWLITTAAQLNDQKIKSERLRELCEKSFSVNLSYPEKLKWCVLFFIFLLWTFVFLLIFLLLICLPGPKSTQEILWHQSNTAISTWGQ